MAVYNIVDKNKLDNSLTATADAIRERSGSSAVIPFDYAGETGFQVAIESLPQGRLPDYDGTVV